MIKVFDIDKNQIALTNAVQDFKIESTLKTGDKAVNFKCELNASNIYIVEGYLQTKTDEYVIKAKRKLNSSLAEIEAVLNLEELEGKSLEDFNSVGQTINNAIKMALVGTGWTVADNNLTKRRTLKLTNKSVLDIINQALKTYRVEVKYDSLNKIIYFYEQLGSDKGTYFIESLNLTSIGQDKDTFKYYTRIIAKSGDNLRIEVTNFNYSKKLKTYIWKDDRYTDEESLREDAISKLEEMAKPNITYTANIIDLSKISNKYSVLSYSLGDVVYLVSKVNNIKDKQRITKITEYPYEPYKNCCELANTTLTFEELQKDFIETSETVNNITTSNGTIDGTTIDGINTTQIIDFEAAIGKVIDFEAINAGFQEITSIKGTIGELESNSIKSEEFETLKAEIAEALIGKVEAEELEALLGKFNILEADTGYIKDLINGNLTSDNIHSLILTGDKVTVENGFIKNAMIDSLDVSKINGGEISLNKFKLVSDNGGIEMFESTQQFKDSNGRVRLQIGQDSEGAFNFILIGEDGSSILLDHTGLKRDAITDGLILNNMLGQGAVTGDKVNISSLVQEINQDGNSTLIKATKVIIDSKKQSLDVVFNSMENSIENMDETVTYHTTQIKANKEKISTLMSDSTITVDGVNKKLKDVYSALEQEVGKVKTTVGQHTTDIKTAIDKSNNAEKKVTTVESNQAKFEQSFNSFKLGVEENYSTKEEITTTTNELYDHVGNVEKELINSYESALEIAKNKILLSVSDLYATSDDLTSIQQALSSKIDQTAKDISLEFNKSTNDVKNDLSEFREQVTSYIRFNIDGMELGKQGSKFKTKLNNEKLAFLQDDEEVAYISNNKLNITDAEIKNKLRLGSFAFIPRSNGNLSLKWIG